MIMMLLILILMVKRRLVLFSSVIVGAVALFRLMVPVVRMLVVNMLSAILLKVLSSARGSRLIIRLMFIVR